MTVGRKPLRTTFVEGGLEFSRVRPIDEALRLVLHPAPRQTLHIERAIDRSEAEVACLRLVTFLGAARGKLITTVGDNWVVDHLARLAECQRIVRIALARHERVDVRDQEYVFYDY